MFRVMTLNIWNLAGPWRDRRQEIVAWINRLEPDAICLQEVMDDGTRSTAGWLAEHADGEWHQVFGGSSVRWAPEQRFGNSVLTREPITDSASYELPYDEDATDTHRVVVHARAGGIDLFSTHLAWRYEVGALRERQVAAIDRIITERADPASPLPPILAGDFNAEPDSTEIRFLSGLASIDGHSTYYQDAWRVAGAAGPGWTWDNRDPFAAAEHEPDRRIDYVFVGWRRDSGAGRVESGRVICDRALTGTFASDHFGVVADIAT
ncbi:MAG: endonuclease/exonuclease/phosphatase family protein [Acidimicrobiales bacterium]